MSNEANGTASLTKGMRDAFVAEMQEFTQDTLIALREEMAIAAEFSSHLAQAYSVNGWSSAVEAYWVHQADLYRRWWGRAIDHQRRLIRKAAETAAASKPGSPEAPDAFRVGLT